MTEDQTAAEFLNAIVDAMADPLFVKDERHCWIAVNQAFCQLMGQPREALLGKSDFDFFPRAQAETFWAKDEEAFRTGEVNSNEEPLTAADGQTYTIVTKKTVFTVADGTRALVGVIRDVTEQKRLEDELRRARDELELRVEQRTREMEEAQSHLRQAQKMETVGQLTGGVAHDFNNLLAVILGNLELLRLRSRDNAALSPLIGSATAAAERGATLTQRLLAFSRRQTLLPRVVDVSDLLTEMLVLLRRTLGEPIEIELNLGAPDACCFADPGQLEGSILNLCINARDAMPAGGRLVVETSVVVLEPGHAAYRDLAPGEYVLIEVTDTGAGMTPEMLERACEPFFTTKEVGKGSGLGLSMVYGFAKQTQGHLVLSSAVGRGTTVKLLLPSHRGERPDRYRRAPAEESAFPRGNGQVVLVVEDDSTVRAMTVLLVEELGYQVEQAGSAREALELIPTLDGLDLLLCDVVLADGPSGPDVAREILRRRPETRILFMSGYASEVLDDDWVKQGCLLLGKPFRRVELAQSLWRALGAGRAR